MRVGLLIYGSLDILSGGYLYDRKLVEYLHSRGDQVLIVALPWRNYLRHLGDNFSKPFRHQLEQLPVDILLQDELNHPSLFWLNYHLKERVAYPIVSIVHHLRSSEAHPAWQKRIYRRLEVRYLNSLDGFIYNSQITKQTVESLAGAHKPGVVAYPGGDRLNPGLTMEQIASRARQPGPLRILFLGNVIRRKGLHTLLAALARLPGHLWTLTVIGSLEMEPGYTSVIQRQVVHERIEQQVLFRGLLAEGELIHEMENHQILVVPSSYEGYGIAYLEGMGFGLPAIASTAGAAKEIITPGVDGYLIEPEDAETLVAYIGQLAEDRQLLADLSLGARRRFLIQPTWVKTIGHIRDFLSAFVNQL